MPAYEQDSDSITILRQLAFDLSIRWSSVNEDIWRRLSPDVWEMTHNPCLVLNAVSGEKIAQHLCDPTFRRRVLDLAEQQRQLLAAPSWFDSQQPDTTLGHVAYFSMEYMLSEALPIYSGGLGNVAGDQLKAASDLGVPVIAIGMLWQHGYFCQEIDNQGRQHALYPVNDTRQLPMEPLLSPDGSLLRLPIELPGLTVWLRGWQVQVGRNRLLLLDSNDPANPVPVRLITEQLYGGDNEMRLRQEIVLGIGGWRLMAAAGYNPAVCHLNDGHAAFAVLERARSYMGAHQVSFDVALMATRAGNLFTTHTPVSDGFDRFDPELLSKYLNQYVEQELGQPFGKILALGQEDAANAFEPFKMAFLAMRCAGAVNAVSQLHESTSRKIFEPIFPRFALADIPIGHITNGVHLPTWVSLEAEEHWRALHSGEIPWRGENDPKVAELLDELSDAFIWQLRDEARATLVVFVRQQLARSEAVHAGTTTIIESAGARLDPTVLTLGFARRFASYKRPNLLLQDPERLLRLLNHPTRPIQLLIAGKAHPADLAGQNMIEQWQAFIRRPDTNGRVEFLEDYDMRLARHLVQGVDVWVNTPRRPWEACGTSGMKVLANGGLNLSQLDGWWAEAFSDDVGWCVGDGEEHGAEHDIVDAAQLYALIEEQVVPGFYERDPGGLPRGWIQRIRRSMGQLVAQYSADRAVRDYAQHYYFPLARAYAARNGNHSASAVRLAGLLKNVAERWDNLRFLGSTSRRCIGCYYVELQVDLAGIPPEQLRVQLYREGDEQRAAGLWDLQRICDTDDATPSVYAGEVPDDCPENLYTGRVIIASCTGLTVPLEAPFIRWQK
jgi:starch phosphorylase